MLKEGDRVFVAYTGDHWDGNPQPTKYGWATATGPKSVRFDDGFSTAVGKSEVFESYDDYIQHQYSKIGGLNAMKEDCDKDIAKIEEHIRAMQEQFKED